MATNADLNWQPAPESLRQLAGCLKDSLSGWDQAAQKQALVVCALPSAFAATNTDRL